VRPSVSCVFFCLLVSLLAGWLAGWLEKNFFFLLLLRESFFFAPRRFDALTVWEQIDGGRPWTLPKQIFLAVPTLFLLFALNAADYDKVYMLVNLPLFLIFVVLPKIPVMHKVRLFGINRTVGIDDPVHVVTTKKHD